MHPKNIYFPRNKYSKNNIFYSTPQKPAPTLGKKFGQISVLPHNAPNVFRRSNYCHTDFLTFFALIC